MYVMNSWIMGGVASMQRWSISAITSKRTNNDLEGYHHRLQKRLGLKLNIWKFIEKLQKEENSIFTEIARLNLGVLPAIDPVVAKKNADLTLLKERFNDDLITAHFYVLSIARLSMPNM